MSSESGGWWRVRTMWSEGVRESSTVVDERGVDRKGVRDDNWVWKGKKTF